MIRCVYDFTPESGPTLERAAELPFLPVAGMLFEFHDPEEPDNPLTLEVDWVEWVVAQSRLYIMLKHRKGEKSMYAGWDRAAYERIFRRMGFLPHHEFVG